MATGITMQFTKAPRGMLKALKREKGRGMELALFFWHGTIARKHFEPQARSLYGYAKRTRRYSQRKAVQVHHQRPLEFTGESKKKILKGLIDIKVRGKTATLKYSGLPKYFNIKSRALSAGGRAQQPDKAQELTFVLQSESDQMLGVTVRHIEKVLGNVLER